MAASTIENRGESSYALCRMNTAVRIVCDLDCIIATVACRIAFLHQLSFSNRPILPSATTR